MDYKYIEQLLERYWECQTTLDEEAILRAFFCSDDVPASLLKYRPLFVYAQRAVAEERLTEAFDRKLLAQMHSNKPVKAQHVSLSARLRPLLKAVAVVAVLLTLSNAIQMSFDANRSAAEVVEVIASDSAALQVAQSDSIAVDTLQHTRLAPQEIIEINQVGSDILPID